MFALEITSNVITYQGRRTELATLRDITARQHVMNMLGETTDSASRKHSGLPAWAHTPIDVAQRPVERLLRFD